MSVDRESSMTFCVSVYVSLYAFDFIVWVLLLNGLLLDKSVTWFVLSGFGHFDGFCLHIIKKAYHSYISLFEHIFSFLFSKYLRIKLCVQFIRNLKNFIFQTAMGRGKDPYQHFVLSKIFGPCILVH